MQTDRFRHILLTALMSLVIAAGAQAQNHKYGINTAIFTPNHQAAVDELGAGAIRVDFRWHDIEPQQDQFNWGATDEWVAAASARGLSILASMSYTPQWAGPAWTGECSDGHCMPYNLADWQDFVHQVISRYSWYPNITFGVWNEPNLHFLNDDGTALQYSYLYQYADAARDAANPNAILAGPETSQHAVENNSYFSWALSRIAPFQNPQDVITAHWYPGGGTLQTYLSNLHNMTSRNIWLGEIGRTGCDDNGQASFYHDALQLMWVVWPPDFPRLQKAFFYVLQNDISCSDAIIRPDWSRRPAFYTYRDFIDAHP